MYVCIYTHTYIYVYSGSQGVSQPKNKEEKTRQPALTCLAPTVSESLPGARGLLLCLMTAADQEERLGICPPHSQEAGGSLYHTFHRAVQPQNGLKIKSGENVPCRHIDSIPHFQGMRNKGCITFPLWLEGENFLTVYPRSCFYCDRASKCGSFK